MKTLLKFTLLIIITSLLNHCQSTKSLKLTDEEYQIYSLIIDTDIVQPQIKIIVVNDSTIFDFFFQKETDRSIDSLYLKIIISGFHTPDSLELYNDYVKYSLKQFQLYARKFTSNKKIVLLKKSEIRKFFKEPKIDNWENFYTKYSTSGYIQFCRVGFNNAHTRAIVYVEKFCGWRCGEGKYLLLEKRLNNWEIVQWKGMWES